MHQLSHRTAVQAVIIISTADQINLMIISWYRLIAQQLLFYKLAHGVQLEISQGDEIHHQKSYVITDYFSHISLVFHSLQTLKIIHSALLCPNFWSLNPETFFW